MTDYAITLPDGTTFESPTNHEALGMALAYQNDTSNSPRKTVEELTQQIKREINEAQARKRRNRNLAR